MKMEVTESKYRIVTRRLFLGSLLVQMGCVSGPYKRVSHSDIELSPLYDIEILTHDNGRAIKGTVLKQERVRTQTVVTEYKEHYSPDLGIRLNSFGDLFDLPFQLILLALNIVFLPLEGKSSRLIKKEQETLNSYVSDDQVKSRSVPDYDRVINLIIKPRKKAPIEFIALKTDQSGSFIFKLDELILARAYPVTDIFIEIYHQFANNSRPYIHKVGSSLVRQISAERKQQLAGQAELGFCSLANLRAEQATVMFHMVEKAFKLMSSTCHAREFYTLYKKHGRTRKFVQITMSEFFPEVALAFVLETVFFYFTCVVLQQYGFIKIKGNCLDEVLE